MKRLWIALGILVVLFGAALYHSSHLKEFAEELTGLLTQAQAHAEAGRWTEAEAFTRTAQTRWTGADLYLHITLRHGDTDQIETQFGAVLEFLHSREQGEYSAANAELISCLQLLYEAEQLTFANVL